MKDRLIHVLRWSEKYTKTDMVYLASGGFWLTLGQGVSSLSAFALAIGFANLVPPETYGTYKYLLSIAAIFSLFTLPGMSTAITRSVALGDEATIHTATKMRVLWSFLGTLSAFAGGLYYFINGNIELAIALAIIGTALPLFDTLTTYNGYLTGKRNFKKQSLFHFVSQSISTASLVATLFFTNSVLLLLLAYFVPLSFIRLFLYQKTAREIPASTPNKETLTYGKHLSLINVLGVVAGNIDKILLWKFLGPAQLAIYAFAIALPNQIKGPLRGIGELAFPKFAAQSPEQMRENMPSLWRKVFLYAAGLMFLSLFYYVLAPLIFRTLFPLYTDAILYSQIIALSFFTNAPSIFGYIIVSLKKIKEQYRLSFGAYIFQIIISLALIPQLGILGAIIALLVSRIFVSITIMIYAIYILYTHQE